MKFKSKIDEVIFVAEILPERRYMFNNDLKTGLSIIWNTGGNAMFTIDGRQVEVGKNCVIFLTEYFTIDNLEFESFNVIQFNRAFYCVQQNDELGCRGLLFYGGTEVPKIIIPNNQVKYFKQVWEIFMHEIDVNADYKLEMLKNLLLHFLILCVRTYKKQNSNLPTDNISVGLIREFNYLVEIHYKKYTKVSDYAKLLHKSPKTLANIFKKYIDKSPLQIINERRLLEAKRLLKYSEATIYEIADELAFNDIQAFSHFFSTKAGISPTSFRTSFK